MKFPYCFESGGICRTAAGCRTHVRAVVPGAVPEDDRTASDGPRGGGRQPGGRPDQVPGNRRRRWLRHHGGRHSDLPLRLRTPLRSRADRSRVCRGRKLRQPSWTRRTIRPTLRPPKPASDHEQRRVVGAGARAPDGHRRGRRILSDTLERRHDHAARLVRAAHGSLPRLS